MSSVESARWVKAELRKFGKELAAPDACTSYPGQVQGRVTSIRRVDDAEGVPGADGASAGSLLLDVTTLEGAQLRVSVSERGYTVEGGSGTKGAGGEVYESLHAMLATRSKGYMGEFAGPCPLAL